MDYFDTVNHKFSPVYMSHVVLAASPVGTEGYLMSLRFYAQLCDCTARRCLIAHD
jgi:hypothetical protein